MAVDPSTIFLGLAFIATMLTIGGFIIPSITLRVGSAFMWLICAIFILFSPTLHIASTDVSIDVAAILAKTNLIPATPADEATSLLIKTQTDKITALETKVDDAMIEIETIEHHFHNSEYWYGISANQTVNDWALQNTLSPFRATSGNNAWGTEGADPAKIFGTDDTPIISGGLSGDFHRILILDNSSATVYKLRIIWDPTSAAAGVTAGNYSEFMFIKEVADKNRKILDIMTPKISAGSKMWMECWNATNDATIDFFVGVHEYY